jgi:hypothetical protein
MLCLMGTASAFADGSDSSDDAPQERGALLVTFGLTQVSGNTYRMWAQVANPGGEEVTVTLKLFNGGYVKLVSFGTVSTDTIIYISKEVTLIPGTYHLRVIFRGDTVANSAERTYYV